MCIRRPLRAHLGTWSCRLATVPTHLIPPRFPCYLLFSLRFKKDSGGLGAQERDHLLNQLLNRSTLESPCESTLDSTIETTLESPLVTLLLNQLLNQPLNRDPSRDFKQFLKQSNNPKCPICFGNSYKSMSRPGNAQRKHPRKYAAFEMR